MKFTKPATQTPPTPPPVVTKRKRKGKGVATHAPESDTEVPGLPQLARTGGISLRAVENLCSAQPPDPFSHSEFFK
jgi:hypothetical protein